MIDENDDVTAARLRFAEREAREARFDLLEQKIPHMDMESAQSVIAQMDPQLLHLDDDRMDTDINFVRGLALHAALSERQRLDSDHERARLDSIRAVRDTIRANAEYGARYGAPPGLRSHHDTLTDEDRAREQAADAMASTWSRPRTKPTEN